MSDKLSHGGSHYARLRLQRQQTQAMEPEIVAAALDEKLTEQAGKLLSAFVKDSQSAAARRTKAVVAFAVYAEAASSIAEAEDRLKYTQSWLRDYVSQAPTEREILLRTSFFNPAMRHSLDRLFFSVQEPDYNESPLEYAAGLITGQVTIAI